MQPWSYVSRAMDLVLNECILLPDLLTIINDFAFELDIFYDLQKMLKKRNFKARPNYPFVRNTQFSSIGFACAKTGAYEMEVLVGDLSGIVLFNNQRPHKWTISKYNRCELIDKIINQKHPKTIDEVAISDAQFTILRLFIPIFCAHVARHRLQYIS